jgi:hypothetical protein
MSSFVFNISYVRIDSLRHRTAHYNILSTQKYTTVDCMNCQLMTLQLAPQRLLNHLCFASCGSEMAQTLPLYLEPLIGTTM